MKIEKINDNQIKFTLSEEDLSIRNIKIDELSIPSDKIQNLFKDIMEKAEEQCNFIGEDVPLMVEAIPSSGNGIMIIVTRLPDEEISKEKRSSLYQNKNSRRFKKTELSDIIINKEMNKYYIIYSFTSLDSVTSVSKRINNLYSNDSSLYKYNDEYFLILEKPSEKSDKFSKIESILNEYGIKYGSNILSNSYISEHGELILDSYATKLLSQVK